MSIIKMLATAWRAADQEGHFRCSWCRTLIEYTEDEPEHSGTIDHMDESFEPLNDPSNMVAACRICNAVRGSGSVEEYAALSERLRDAGLDDDAQYRDVEAQVLEPIDLDKGHDLAERFYPKRMAYLREAARERGHRASASTFDRLDTMLPF